jgi:membrane-bound ClpP family serine protease
MDLNTWGVALLAFMFVLLFVELFLPTGGVLGMVAAVVGISGLVCLFRYDLNWGFSGLLALVVLLPAFAAFAFRIWPQTPMGRRVIGTPSDEEVDAKRLAELRERERLTAMVGKEGLVLTALRPVGLVEIDGARMDALSETMYVRAGAKVKVTYADGSQIKVREIS